MNQPQIFQLTQRRIIRAPRERVFDAFVKIEHAREWMCPRGMSMAQCEFDVRPGGSYRFTMRARDGDQFTVGGSYREILRPERLTYT